MFCLKFYVYLLVNELYGISISMWMYVFNVLIMIVEKSCNNFRFSVSSKA